MLTQNHLMESVPTSACSSSSSSESYTLHSENPSIKKEPAVHKKENSPSNIDFDGSSPKSDIGNCLDSATMASSPYSNNNSNNNVNDSADAQSSAAPIMTNESHGSAELGLGATAAIAPTSNTTPSAQRMLFGAQMPIDINAMFGKFFGNSMNENKNSASDFAEKTSPSPIFDNFCLSSPQQLSGIDQAAFLQLSHLLAAQQPTSTVQKSDSGAQKSQAQMRQNNRHDSISSNSNSLQDRKRSYPYTFQYCVLCQKNVHSSKLPCHIRQCHVGKPMFQCPACDFTSTYSKNNVKSHMVSLHGLAGDPISYMDQYAGQVEEFMKKCFPNVRGRGRPVHGRLSPSVNAHHHVTNGGGMSSRASSNSNTSPAITHDELLRRNSSPITATSHIKMDFSDNESNSVRSHNRAHANPHEAKCSSLNSPHAPAPMSANSLTNAARFNEIYTMAMLGGKSLSEKFNPLLANNNNNNNNDYPLQNLNPLFYIQQLSQLNASNGASNFDRHKIKVEEDKAFGNGGGDYMGVEQILKDFHQTFEQNGTSNTNFPNNDGKVANANSPNNFFRSQTNESPRSRRRRNSPENLNLFGSSNSILVDDELSSGRKASMEPRYLPQALKWTVLEGDQLENTVFKMFSNSSSLIEKMDLSPFESLLDKSNAFLTNAQAKTISQVRETIGLKSFEIMFAVHRLDLQVLKPENVRLVMSIMPTDVDIRRFSAYEQSNSVTCLNDDEQFILQLSKIDRLKEKLAVMDFMGSFGENLHKVNQQISDLMTATKILQNSSEFHTILHLLLTCGNLIIGDFNAQLVEGFKPSRILEMCAFKFPSFKGESDEKVTLMDVVAARIAKCFAYLDRFCNQSKVMEDASKVQFSSILLQIQNFENGIRLIEAELQSSGPNTVLSGFLVQCELETTQCKEMVQLAKDKIIGMLQFFGELSPEEDLGEFRPERFFATIAEFANLLESAILAAYSSTSRRSSSSAAQAVALIPA